MKETYEYLQKNVRLIGLSGAAGSGKDYVAKILCNAYNFHNWSLAWHFKTEAVTQGIGSHDEVFHTKPTSIRNVLQIMGTELGRDRFGEDWWTNMALNWIRLLHEQWGYICWVIPDVRFPNELEGIRKSGGKIYRVISDVQNRSLTEKAKEHASETSLSDDSSLFDGVIRNYIKTTPEEGRNLSTTLTKIILDWET